MKEAHHLDPTAFAHRPHNNYFLAVASIPEVAEEMLRCALPELVLAELYLDTLQLAPDSFVDAKLKESLSDLVYTCQRSDGSMARVCLLMEHKSERPGRRLLLQLLRYMQGIMESDLKARRKNFSLTIPIVFYHGKKPWKPKTLRHFFGNLPPSLAGHIPDFEFHTINLQAMSDEQIMAMQQAHFVRNIFLAMKHAWEDEFFRSNFGKIVIFDTRKVGEELLEILFLLTLQYILYVTSIKKEEAMQLVQATPASPRAKQRAKSTAENLIDFGIEEGLKQGMEQGMELSVRGYLLKRPQDSDELVADLLNVPLAMVVKVRRTLNSQN